MGLASSRAARSILWPRPRCRSFVVRQARGTGTFRNKLSACNEIRSRVRATVCLARVPKLHESVNAKRRRNNHPLAQRRRCRRLAGRLTPPTKRFGTSTRAVSLRNEPARVKRLAYRDKFRHEATNSAGDVHVCSCLAAASHNRQREGTVLHTTRTHYE